MYIFSTTSTHVLSAIETRQRKATTPEDSSSIFKEKMSCCHTNFGPGDFGLGGPKSLILFRGNLVCQTITRTSVCGHVMMLDVEEYSYMAKTVYLCHMTVHSAGLS